MSTRRVVPFGEVMFSKLTWVPLFLIATACVGCPPRGLDPICGTGVTGIAVHNTSGKVIAVVYIAPTGSAEWGENLLGDLSSCEGDEIRNGGQQVFQLEPGLYDIRIEAYCNCIFGCRQFAEDFAIEVEPGCIFQWLVI